MNAGTLTILLVDDDSAIRALEASVPVLFISGDSMNADRGYGCVAKPFTYADLVGRVRHALDTSPHTSG